MASERPPTGGPRPPSLLDALLPIVVLIGLLALTIALFGVSATDGPLQVALLLSAAFASLIAFKNGYTVAVSRRGGRGRGHHRDECGLHPARGRRADRHLEHGRHDPDRRRHRHPAGQPDLVLLHHRRRVRPGGHGHGQLVDHRGHPGCRVRRHEHRARPRRGGRGRRGHLRGVLRRQDDAAVGDHDPGAAARRWRPHCRPARAEHVLDGRPGPGGQPRPVPPARARRRPRCRGQHRQGARRRSRRRSTSLPSPCCRFAAGGPCRAADAAVPVDPRLRGVRCRARPVPPVGRGGGLRRRPEPRQGRDRREGGLRRHGHRLRQRLRRAPDRRPVLARRHGQHAHHDLAGPRARSRSPP